MLLIYQSFISNGFYFKGLINDAFSFFNPKLPNLPRKCCIRPAKQENKATTIGIGFECMEGLILGADRQMTSPDGSPTLSRGTFSSLGCGIPLVFEASGF
jgi:hypothetical protein